MIVACPGCSARYQIEAENLRPEGVRLRCTRCEAVFRVSPPPTAARAVQAPPVAPASPATAPPADVSSDPAPSLPPPMSRPTPAAVSSPPSEAARERMVLIADPEIEQGKATASALVQWGFQPTLVHDGVEAILAIQRLLPRAIVIDAALPKMFGFQVCELVKRNESLRHIHVVLVGAIHDKMRYRRPPEEIYGADAYIERQELTRSLRSILQDFGMSASAAPIQAPQPAAPAPRAAPAAVVPEAAAPTPSTPPAAVPAELISEPPIPADPIAHVEAPPAALSETEVSTASPSAESIASTAAPSPRPTADPVAGSATAGATPGGDARIQEAERLARIVVSDIVLYSKEKFDAAVAAGNVLEAMEPEIAEGRSLFTSRVDPEIQQMRDFLADELLRVAETKGKP